jgi:mannosyltransferase OCH1-like enzyme
MKRKRNIDKAYNDTVDRRPAGNSGFAKKRVQWLIEHSTSHQILWFVDSFVLRNPLLRKAAKR